MRKIIMFNLITVDGFFEGQYKWDIGWHHVDKEFNEFAIDQLNHADGLIFGRVTYLGMASYWSTPAALQDDPQVASLMNSIRKYVFSRTLQAADWNNTVLVTGEAVSELKKLREQPGKDLLIFGSGDLSKTFASHDLIDEYRLMVNPVILGKGGALFHPNGDMLKLKLLNTRAFGNGNVLLYYQPDGK